MSKREIESSVLNIFRYHLFMYRHSTFYNSLQYSTYIIAKFQTWKDTGIKKLGTLLVDLGVSLKDSQQPWDLVPSTIKSNILQKLVNSKLSLDNIQYLSCSRVIHTMSSNANMRNVEDDGKDCKL